MRYFKFALAAKALLITAVALTSMPATSFGVLIDDDFTSGAIGVLDSNRYERQDIGNWTARDGGAAADWAIQDGRLEALTGNQQKGVAIVKAVGDGESGNQITVSFDWTAIGATGDDLTLSYNVFGYHSDAGGAATDRISTSALNFSGTTGGKFGNLEGNASLVDFTNGFESPAGFFNQWDLDDPSVLGVADGSAVHSTTTFDISGLSTDGNDISKYDYVGLHFFVLSQSHPGTYIDNVSVTAASTGDPTGDFDNDGDVDGADFLEWQRSIGTPTALSAWQAEYGDGGPSVASAANVPEPSTLGMSSLALLVCLSGAVRRSR
ncbi:hypothetical protein [Adhaeretor mobilis]|uniref:PEP-CTERM protein-sorting domain-containing protein n=1 Tax=Adhaeretor mobilis TaxID=1930276 RepID=A0A517MUC0_9BACT|nr:hypothetical protein [Adhaeretor mobilis]QDS98478.1 hypothetical protein HG15A2_17580 [Adhaeretor mobilis]